VSVRVLLMFLLLGAISVANLAGIGVLVHKLKCVEDKLQDIQDLQVGERLGRLEMQVAPRPVVPQREVRAVAD
jgi:hypothetical protein